MKFKLLRLLFRKDIDFFQMIRILLRKRKLEEMLSKDVFKNVDLYKVMNPALSKTELENMEADWLPTDDEILKYYKMYVKKFQLDRENKWSVEEPMLFEEWEKRAKATGGYRYMIGHTVDAFIGSPYTIYHRYRDYEKLVQDDNK